MMIPLLFDRKRKLRNAALGVALLCCLDVAHAQSATPSGCNPSGGFTFICGLENAEDLVSVPGTQWVLSSGMLPGGGIYLIDSTNRTWAQMIAAPTMKVQQDKAVYGRCPGAPEPEQLATHGLNIRHGTNGHSTLYVVGHGGREAIEVFDVDANSTQPMLTWIGCVPMPDGVEANSVASLRDGSLLVTVLMHPGQSFSDVFSGTLTGAIYRWSPGDNGFELVQGSQLPGNNGIEVSADEQEVYVVSTGLFSISAFSNSNPTRLLRSTETLDFGPDNIHMTPDGQLLTAGPSRTDHQCGTLDPANFDLEVFASCPKGSVAATFDPETMVQTARWSRPANTDFSNATMALEVAGEVWVGSFAGDRIGIVKP